jgi:hypothetical protein
VGHIWYFLMNNTIAQQVEKWYAEHSESLSHMSTKLRIRSIEPSDAIEGKVAIEMETQEMLASVAFWNLGDVSFITVNKQSGKENVVDRKLGSSDDIPSLLDGYFREVTGSAG